LLLCSIFFLKFWNSSISMVSVNMPVQCLICFMNHNPACETLPLIS
jgi:hypothetical protein